jgi:hypothetical protein
VGVSRFGKVPGVSAMGFTLEASKRALEDAGVQHPNHDSIAAFRQRHLRALAGLFVQVLKLCEAAGSVKHGHTALDGTKLKANASKHKAASYERMCRKEKELKAEVARLLEEAERVDAP